MDYADVIARESARAADALAAAPPGRRVPSCPDWDAADLAYHLGEVQDFWGNLVAQAPAGPDDLDETVRRPDDELVPFLRTRTAALLDALAAHDPQDPCWSWSAAGGTVGWVLPAAGARGAGAPGRRRADRRSAGHRTRTGRSRPTASTSCSA